MSEKDLESGKSSEGLENIPAVPSAIVGPARLSMSDLLRGSYMWLVALLCLCVSIGVAWWSMPAQGIKIVIHFPEGHGLAAEDPVRFRGIDVGVVENVKLNRELTGVDVTVNLLPFAEPLAREGTRFWIVRPQLSLGGISGLDTAVGHKYIGLIPGAPDTQWQSVFEGLASSPPDAMQNDGVEIILRGEERFSVTAGSPLDYRGVIIGRVLSIGLSPDGQKVDARLRVFDKFTKLITSESKFWASSGISASFSPIGGGINFEMESIETLVQGGVSVLTIEAGGRPIKPGDDFVLNSSAGKDWFEKASNVQATDINTRGAIPMELAWKQKGLLGMGKSDRRREFVGALLKSDNGMTALIPTDMLAQPSKAIPGSVQVGITGLPKSQVALTDNLLSNSPLTTLTLANLNANSFPASFRVSERRVPLKPESCVAVRANGDLGDLRYLPLRIEAEEIGDDWDVKNFDGDRSVWHGAPVLSEIDGYLIGILLVDELKTRIELIPAEHVAK